MSEFQVFSGVPLPTTKRASGPRGSKYPFADLDVGDFFVVNRTVKQMGSTVRAHEKATRNKFAIRSGPIAHEGQEIVPAGSVGIWRVEIKPEVVKKAA
jgi:hypothetical protein